MPMLTTSIEKTAAAIGVPKTAEKAALIPQRTTTLLSASSNLNQRPS